MKTHFKELRTNPIIFTTIALILISCSNNTENKKANKDNSARKTKKRECHPSDHFITSTLWYQYSKEMKGIYYQTYNSAKKRLKFILQNSDITGEPAVILDIDETVLNNSPYTTKLIKNNEDYSKKSWNKWVRKKDAKALPGALEFTQFARSKNVEVFYISNRYKETKTATIKNLKSLNFPYVDKEHILLRTNTGDKTKRRDSVRKDHTILLLIGDSMGDLKENADINNKKIQKKMGKKYFLLPNPLYGNFINKIDAKEDNIIKARKDALKE